MTAPDDAIAHLDMVGDIALRMVSDVREVDPQRVLDGLMAVARREPLIVAQVCMALALMVSDTDTVPMINARILAAATWRGAA